MMKKEAHNPLFLKMACEELRVFGVFEKVRTPLPCSYTSLSVLVMMKEAHNPLFLKMACEELSVFGVYNLFSVR